MAFILGIAGAIGLYYIVDKFVDNVVEPVAQKIGNVKDAITSVPDNIIEWKNKREIKEERNKREILIDSIKINQLERKTPQYI